MSVMKCVQPGCDVHVVPPEIACSAHGSWCRDPAAIVEENAAREAYRIIATKLLLLQAEIDRLQTQRKTLELEWREALAAMNRAIARTEGIDVAAPPAPQG